MNSGNFTQNSVNNDSCDKSKAAQEEPLLNGKSKHDTVSSMDSALSNSDNCSDIELGNIAKK